MSSETIYKYSSQVTAISNTATITSGSFTVAGDVANSLSSAQTGKYPMADVSVFASFSTSISSASNTLILYRRDLNIDGANSTPQPGVSGYSGIQVGYAVVPSFTAGSTCYVFMPSIPLAGDCEFYLQNATNSAVASGGFVVKVTPKTYTPAP